MAIDVVEKVGYLLQWLHLDGKCREMADTTYDTVS
jgi:hypothetical protein